MNKYLKLNKEELCNLLTELGAQKEDIIFVNEGMGGISETTSYSLDLTVSYYQKETCSTSSFVFAA